MFAQLAKVSSRHFPDSTQSWVWKLTEYAREMLICSKNCLGIFVSTHSPHGFLLFVYVCSSRRKIVHGNRVHLRVISRIWYWNFKDIRRFLEKNSLFSFHFFVYCGILYISRFPERSNAHALGKKDRSWKFWFPSSGGAFKVRGRW